MLNRIGLVIMITLTSWCYAGEHAIVSSLVQAIRDKNRSLITRLFDQAQSPVDIRLVWASLAREGWLEDDCMRQFITDQYATHLKWRAFFESTTVEAILVQMNPVSPPMSRDTGQARREVQPQSAAHRNERLLSQPGSEQHPSELPLGPVTTGYQEFHNEGEPVQRVPYWVILLRKLGCGNLACVRKR